MSSAIAYVTLPALLQRTPARPGLISSSAEFRRLPAAIQGFDLALEEAGAAAAPKSAPVVAHVVARGDSLWEICRDRLQANGGKPIGAEVHDAVQAVAKANGLKDPGLIHVGQRLDVSAVVPRQSSGDGVAGAAAARSSQLIASSSQAAAKDAMPRSPASPADASAANPAASAPEAALSARERAAKILQELRAEIEAARGNAGANKDAEEADAAAVARTDMARLMEDLLAESGVPKEKRISDKPWRGLLRSPVARLSSSFGMRRDPFSGRPQHHNGIDVAAPLGTKIYPYAPGTVVKSGWNGGYGRMVIVKHPDGTETRYGHTSKNLVKVGDKVAMTEPIAEVGSTGRSTGPHLHFEMRRNGKPIDPVPYLSGTGFSVARK